MKLHCSGLEVTHNKRVCPVIQFAGKADSKCGVGLAACPFPLNPACTLSPYSSGPPILVQATLHTSVIQFPILLVVPPCICQTDSLCKSVKFKHFLMARSISHYNNDKFNLDDY